MLFSMQRCLVMFSNSCLYLTVILLAAQEAKARVQVSTTCGANTQMMENAVAEAIAMAGFAHARQGGLRDGVLNLPDWRVALNTFNAYFGPLAAPGTLTGQNGEFVAPNAMQMGNRLISKSASNKWLCD